jgi:short-subunit dehydrogenase
LIEMSLTKSLRKIAVVGASRGLGLALCQEWATEGISLFAVARRIEALPSLLPETLAEYRGVKTDLSQPVQVAELLEELVSWKPEVLVYVAGGGPFGLFAQKDFKDHQWAFQVSFLAMAQLVHGLLTRARPQQIILIGSSVAESRGDPRGASYSAAKHALLGLCQSLWLEDPELDLRLFSPTFMDTDLLPPGAEPRKKSEKIRDPREVARFIVESASDSAQHGAWWVDSQRVK